MKKLKHLLVLAFFTVCSAIVSAQSGLTIEASQLYSSFNFYDTEGNQLNNEYSGIFTGAYGVGYNYLTDFGLMIRPGIGMRNGGASMVYDDINYSYRLKYASAKLGVGYMHKFEKINPYFLASGYYAYLLQGTQVLNNEHFDITKSGSLSKMDYGVILAPGVEFTLSEYVSSYLELKYFHGLENIEMDEGQVTTNTAYAVSLGLLFTIK